MSDISLSKAVRSNLLSLQNTATMMGKTQDRLASGNKVNSALDNPTNFFTAGALNSRAGDLNALMDSMANGIQTLEAADNGLTSITKTLESMQATLRQARQDKTFQTDSIEMEKIDPNFDPTKQFTLSGGAVGNPVSFDMVIEGSGFSTNLAAAYEAPVAAQPATLTGTVDLSAGLVGATTFDVTFGGTTQTITLGVDAARDTLPEVVTAVNEQLELSSFGGRIEAIADGTELRLQTTSDVDGDITVANGDAAAVFGATPVDQPGSNGSLDFTINGKNIQVLPAATDADAAVTSINTQLGPNAKFEAYKDVGGIIGIRATTDDAGTLTIGGADAALFDAPAEVDDLKFAASVTSLVNTINTQLEGKVRASNDNGKLRIENLSTQDLSIEGRDPATLRLDGSTGSTTSILGNSVRSDLSQQYNELRDQLDKLSDDASFNGINLLRGDNLRITFNETGTSSIDIQTKSGESLNSATLKLSDIAPEDLDDDVDIDTLLADLKGALSDVRSQSSRFGQNLSIVENRQNFTKEMINTLQTGAANLTLADMNEEAANLLALQTRQSLSSSSLSLASQADQSVLQLLQ